MVDFKYGRFRLGLWRNLDDDLLLHLLGDDDFFLDDYGLDNRLRGRGRRDASSGQQTRDRQHTKSYKQAFHFSLSPFLS